MPREVRDCCCLLKILMFFVVVFLVFIPLNAIYNNTKKSIRIENCSDMRFQSPELKKMKCLCHKQTEKVVSAKKPQCSWFKRKVRGASNLPTKTTPADTPLAGTPPEGPPLAEAPTCRKCKERNEQCSNKCPKKKAAG